MAPPILGAIKTIFTPKKWFKDRPELQADSTTIEERQRPVPGVYKHVLGRGWFLAARITYRDQEKTFEPVSPPIHVTYSRVLHQYLFDDDYARRKTQSYFHHDPIKDAPVGFFRVDDVAWVNCWDEEGNFLPGPYKRYVPDELSKKFRPMTRLDDPEYQEKKKKSKERGGQQALHPGTAATATAAATADPDTLSIPRQLTDVSASTTSSFYPKLWDTDAESNRPGTGISIPDPGHADSKPPETEK